MRRRGIRVLHVTTSLGRGGAERQLVDVVTNTNRADFEHIVCYLRPPDAFAEAIRDAGHQVIGLQLKGKHPFLAAAARLSTLLRSLRPDIMHTWLYDANISARLARFAMRQIPIITSLQSMDYEPETIRAARLSRFKVGALRLLDRASGACSGSLFIACSRSVEQSARKYLAIPPARIRVIYNSVDPDTLLCEPGEPEMLRRELNIPEDATVYLTVGRLDPPKGHACLLRAFQKLALSDPLAYLVAVGDGPLAANLRQLAAELGVLQQVRFTGRRSDIGAFLEMADIFVFPSFFEGFSLALLEAMSKGLPCIASRIPPNMEAIDDGDTGMLITPGDVDGLAAAMANLRDDPALRGRLGSQGREQVTQRFHSRVIIGQWEELYRAVAQQGLESNRVRQEAVF